MHAWVARWKAKHPEHAVALAAEIPVPSIEEMKQWTQDEVVAWLCGRDHIRKAHDAAVLALTEGWLADHPGRTTLDTEDLIEMVQMGVDIEDYSSDR